MPYDGERPATTLELQARGLLPPGPLAPEPVDPDTPTLNEQKIRRTAQETFLQSLERRVPHGLIGSSLGGIAGGVLGGAPGGIGAIPGAIGGAALGGAGEENLRQMIRGDFNPTRVGREALVGGVSQATGEAATVPFRFLGALSRGGTLRQEFTDALQRYQTALTHHGLEVKEAEALAASATKFNKTFAKTLNEAVRRGDMQEAALLVRTWQDTQAGALASQIQQQVPAWRNFPATTEGLTDMVFGKGQKLLSDSFDTALKAAQAEARGKDIVIRLEDALSLGLPVTQKVSSQAGELTTVVVPADAAITSVVGQWTKNPGIYRRVTRELANAGIGNEAARSEYKAGMAAQEFLDVSKAIQPDGAGGHLFDPGAIAKTLVDRKKVDLLRKRGAGDVFEGPFAEATLGRPLPPPTRQPFLGREVAPDLPPRPTPPTPQFRTLDLPLGTHPWLRYAIGHTAGTGALRGLGIEGPGAYVGGSALGALAASAPKEIALPLSPPSRLPTEITPTVFAQILRAMGGTERTPE